MRVKTKRPMQFDSAWLIRVLASSGRGRRCRECDARMFVSAASGLCPICLARGHDLEEIALAEAADK